MADRTIDQVRAGAALEQVLRLQESGDYGHYVSYVKALPATILTNGLGQALATLKAQDKKGNPELFQHLRDWLCRDDVRAPYRAEADLLRAIVTHGQREYRLAQAEALAYLAWLKKLAVAYLKEPEGSA